MSLLTGTCATLGCDAPASEIVAGPRGVWAVCARCCEEITATPRIYDWSLEPEHASVARWRGVRCAALAGYVASLALVAASDRWVAWGAIGMFVAIVTWAFAAAAAEEES